MSNLPEKNADCRQGVVQLKKSMTNAAGEVFVEGQLMVITNRRKRDGTVELRPIRGNIRCSEESVDYVAPREELGFGENQ